MRGMVVVALLGVACGSSEPVVCVYAGTEYSEGSSFPSDDGCNTCDCVESYDGDPVVDCTEMACPT